MERYKKKMMVLLVLLLAIVAVIGTSYALWQFTSQQLDDNTVTSGCFKINYTDRNPIDLNDALPITDDDGKKLTPYEFVLTNICDTRAAYQINLEILDDTNVSYDNLVKMQFQNGTPVLLSTKSITDTTVSGAVKAYVLGSGTLEASEEKTFSLRLWIDGNVILNSDDLEKVFDSKVTVIASYVSDTEDRVSLYNIIKDQASLDDTSSEFVTGGIDFDVEPSDINGKGVYTMASTKDSQYPVHYFRGNVINNNVKFANFCWKIVRTTETGGVKLVYNGTPDGAGGCTNVTGEATQIETSVFNEDMTSADFVGYMYPESTNANSSSIKTVIDTWYQNNMTDYTKYLEDTVWCNDRSVYKTEGLSIHYGAVERNSNTYNPSIVCPNDNDKFTVNSANGNGKLTYPVALLTADEITLAGSGDIGYSEDSYLNTTLTWWLLSPDAFEYYYDTVYGDHIASYIHVVRGEKLRSQRLDVTVGIRPSVSLASGTKVVTSGDGTPNNPFVVI